MARHDRIVVSTASAPSRGRAKPNATACMGSGPLGLAAGVSRKGQTGAHTEQGRCMRASAIEAHSRRVWWRGSIQSGCCVHRHSPSSLPGPSACAVRTWAGPRARWWPASIGRRPRRTGRGLYVASHGDTSTIGILPMHCSCPHRPRVRIGHLGRRHPTPSGDLGELVSCRLAEGPVRLSLVYGFYELPATPPSWVTKGIGSHKAVRHGLLMYSP